jgi:hypothetical protein
MNKTIKKKWVAALRSGHYQQAKAQLKDNRGRYCCLGVLATVQGARWTKSKRSERLAPWIEGNLVCGGEPHHPATYDAYLSGEFRRRVGLAESHHEHLVSMNDDGASFEAIADYIEENL